MTFDEFYENRFEDMYKETLEEYRRDGFDVLLKKYSYEEDRPLLIKMESIGMNVSTFVLMNYFMEFRIEKEYNEL